MKNEFEYFVERFADVVILRYRVDGFEQLTLQQKLMIYYMYRASLAGRNILYDQNCKHNLAIKSALEAIYVGYTGSRELQEFVDFELYLKMFWFSNGCHHPYSGDKFVARFSRAFLAEQLSALSIVLDDMVLDMIFEPDYMPKRVNQTEGDDLVATSACNYYDGVTMQEAIEFYDNQKEDTITPISYGLNSQLCKEDGQIFERVWQVGGWYGDELTEVVRWLESALEVAQQPEQRQAIEALIEFNRTGNLATFDRYAILWLKDNDSKVDFSCGFTETYGDPLGFKASWESVVYFKNEQASKRTEQISGSAQWFEDNSPVDSRFKKSEVRGVSAKVVTVAALGGDCYPTPPIGINLPNSDWIRREQGSKSVTIENITEAYDQISKGGGFVEEFVCGSEVRQLVSDYAFLTDNLHTDLHECLGHGSGQLLDGVDSDALKSYGAVIEEARADLFGLYYIADHKMVELGLLPNSEAYRAHYYKYILNGLMTQLIRIELGKDIEQAHMRNRQLISKWVLERGAVSGCVELVVQQAKHYIQINDYAELRKLFGELLSEIQRIKSTGDLLAAKQLVEGYGVTVDESLHSEVLERYRSLDIAPYKGFVNPTYELVEDDSGDIIDVAIGYSDGYAEQQCRYAEY